MEKDWKTFRKMVPGLRERYIKEKNEEIRKILTDKNKSETDRFWDAREKIEEERKILIDCLDGHSRSKMFYYILIMYSHGLLKEDDLKEFSDEVQNRIRKHM